MSMEAVRKLDGSSVVNARNQTVNWRGCKTRAKAGGRAVRVWLGCGECVPETIRGRCV